VLDYSVVANQRKICPPFYLFYGKVAVYGELYDKNKNPVSLSLNKDEHL
jgi:hypothetical protein